MSGIRMIIDTTMKRTRHVPPDRVPDKPSTSWMSRLEAREIMYEPRYQNEWFRLSFSKEGIE